MTRSTFPLLLTSLLIPTAWLPGAISYTLPGSTYAENFNSMPTDAPSSANIETVYTDGWRDDTTSQAGIHISVPGWHLFHNISPSGENGFNGNQRFRVGPGANTGAFWAFGALSTDPEKALGSIGSTTVAGNGISMLLGLRLINNTGITLDEVTVTYDGEQWRDGQSASPETLLFDYSATATLADWNTATFTSVAALNFTSPVFAGTGLNGNAVDGNTAGRVGDITATISGVNWAPGAELWLRWSDPQLTGLADDGLAVDNVRVSAIAVVPEPGTVGLFAAGLAGLLIRFRKR